MKLDIRSDKIDPNSEFARAFQTYATAYFEEEFGKGKWTAQSVQTCFDKVRKKIDKSMINYLLTHDGVVDGWPDPDTGLAIECSNGSNDPPRISFFNYFSLGTLGNTLSESATKYRNHYEYTYSRLYEETVYNGEYYGVTLWENRWEIIKYWVARLPMIFAILASVFALLKMIGLDYMWFLDLISDVNDGTVTIVAPGLDGFLLYPFALIFGVPCGFAMFVDLLLVEKLGILGLLLGCAILLGIGYGGYRWLIFKWDDPEPMKQKDIRRRIKAKKAIRNSAEYKRIVAEEEAKRDLCLEMSEQWHRAWYDCYKRNQ